MQFIELQHARKRKFHWAHSVTYETTNCYIYKLNKNLFAKRWKIIYNTASIKVQLTPNYFFRLNKSLHLF